VDIRIGLQNNARELVIDSDQQQAEVIAAVEAALAGSTSLQLTDTKGSTVVVPAAVLAYVEVGAAEARKVGFTG
jgi:nicotinamide mononucleotide (NMN) deamidase PncC